MSSDGPVRCTSCEYEVVLLEVQTEGAKGDQVTRCDECGADTDGFGSVVVCMWGLCSCCVGLGSFSHEVGHRVHLNFLERQCYLVENCV